MSKSFSWHFPVFSLLVRSSLPIVFALGLLATGVFSVWGGQASFSLVLISIALLALWIDRAWFDVWPLPPVVWFISVCFLAGGIGPGLLFAAGTEFQLGDITQMQLGMIVGHGSFFICYYMFRPDAKTCPHIAEMILESFVLRRALVGSCYLLLCFGVAEVVVGAVSGAADRGLAGEKAAFEVFGYWSYFVAFNRLTPIAFLLAPLAWRFSKYFGRLLILIASCYILLMGAASGSRALLLSPLVLLLVGYVGFSRSKRVRSEFIVIGIVPFAVLSFVFLDHYRNTESFYLEPLSNPIKKIGAFSEAIVRADESEDSSLRLIGERLVGNVDPLIYAATPSQIPFAGFDGVDAMLWLYVPSFFYPNRPSLLDATRIGERYLQTALVRTSVGSSFVGDWYRRFGWVGVIFGMASVGVILGLSLKIVIWALRRRPFWGLAAVFVVSTLATKDANMTVATATWMFLYEFPKYYVVLVFVFSAGKMVSSLFCSDALERPLLKASRRRDDIDRFV